MTFSALSDLAPCFPPILFYCFISFFPLLAALATQVFPSSHSTVLFCFLFFSLILEVSQYFHYFLSQTLRVFSFIIPSTTHGMIWKNNFTSKNFIFSKEMRHHFSAQHKVKTGMEAANPASAGTEKWIREENTGQGEEGAVGRDGFTHFLTLC